HAVRRARRAALFREEDAHGRDRISLRAPTPPPHDGGGVWGLGRCWGGGDRCAALPGPPARGRATRHDRPGGVRRLYHNPTCGAPDRRGAAPHPLAAQRVLDLAPLRGRCAAARTAERPASLATGVTATPRTRDRMGGAAGEQRCVYRPPLDAGE